MHIPTNSGELQKAEATCVLGSQIIKTLVLSSHEGSAKKRIRSRPSRYHNAATIHHFHSSPLAKLSGYGEQKKNSSEATVSSGWVTRNTVILLGFPENRCLSFFEKAVLSLDCNYKVVKPYNGQQYCMQL